MADDNMDSADTGSGPASYFPSIEEKYGKTIPQWKQLLRESPGYGASSHGELVGMLKTDFGMGHGHANALVKHTLDEDRRDGSGTS